jgi:hypothetical protein
MIIRAFVNGRDKRRRLAYLLLKNRARLTVRQFHNPQRDIIGNLFADVIGIFRLAKVVLWGANYGDPTEVERRAMVNARNRLIAKIEREKEANA